MEVISDFENKLLGRREVKLTIENAEATITRVNAKSQVVKKFDAKEDLVIIENIGSRYGNSNVTVTASIYDNKETLDKVTAKHIAKRNVIKAVGAEE
jgi:ribosomal protein S24E